MESQRSILIIALAFVSFLLWQQWHEDYGPKPIEPIAQDTTQVAAGVPSASTSVPSTGSEDVPLALQVQQMDRDHDLIPPSLLNCDDVCATK